MADNSPPPGPPGSPLQKRSRFLSDEDEDSDEFPVGKEDEPLHPFISSLVSDSVPIDQDPLVHLAADRSPINLPSLPSLYAMDLSEIRRPTRVMAEHQVPPIEEAGPSSTSWTSMPPADEDHPSSLPSETVWDQPLKSSDAIESLHCLYNLILPENVSGVRPLDLPCDEEEFCDCASDTGDEEFEDATEGPDEFDPDQDCEDWPVEDYSDSDDPLYEGSECTLGMCMTALLNFLLSHRLTKRCLSDLLALLNLLLPPGNKLVKSVGAFFKCFENVESETKRYFYCKVCSTELNSEDRVCARCGPDKGFSFFIQMSISEQIQKFLLRPGFAELLSYPLNRVKTDQDAFEDIYDGNIYKEAVRDHFGNDKWITFTWNTDGFALFRSSTFEIWPFYLAINELPPHLRFRKENMILGGLFFGKGKFDANLFLEPIYKEVEVLKRGVHFEVHSEGNPVMYKAGVLCGTCDSPAKAAFLKHNLFNGLFGCLKCLSRGEKSDRTGRVFVHPYIENLIPRTDETQRQHLDVLRNTRHKKWFGVKGPSYLQPMLLISLIRSTSVDVMHAVFLGVMKYMLSLWFDKKFKDENYSLFKRISVVDEYLLSVKPPHFFQRAPQPVSKLKFWKASEFQSFLLYYCVPIFSKVMDQVLFNHFLLFYYGITLLCQSSVTPADVILAQALLDNFVKQFEEFYSLRYMTFNLHLLRHLPDVVQELGPLWTSSCFMFEDMNGTLKYLVHGTQHAALQVKRNFELITRLPTMLSDMPEGKLKDLCYSIHTRNARLHFSVTISDNVYAVGRISKELAVNEMITNHIEAMQGNASYFKRLKVGSCLFVAWGDNSFRKESSHVYYRYQDRKLFGRVHIFIKLSQCMCDEVCDCLSEYFAVVQSMNSDLNYQTFQPPAQIKCVHTVTLSNVIHSIPIENIENVCVQLQVEEKCFVIPVVNQCNFHQ